MGEYEREERRHSREIKIEGENERDIPAVHSTARRYFQQEDFASRLGLAAQQASYIRSVGITGPLFAKPVTPGLRSPTREE
jgi:hypothetical protein